MNKVTINEKCLSSLPSLDELEKYGTVNESSNIIKEIPSGNIGGIRKDDKKENEKPGIVKSSLEHNLTRVQISVPEEQMNLICSEEKLDSLIVNSGPHYDNGTYYSNDHDIPRTVTLAYDQNNIVAKNIVTGIIDIEYVLDKAYINYHQTPESIIEKINCFFNAHNLQYEVKRKEEE